MSDIEAIRKRCEAATAKPWTVRDNDGFWCGRLLAPNSEGVPIPLMHFDFTPTCRDHLGETWPNDLDFIAHAREDIPELLEEVDRLKTLLTEALVKYGFPGDAGPAGQGWPSDGCISFWHKVETALGRQLSYRNWKRE